MSRNLSEPDHRKWNPTVQYEIQFFLSVASVIARKHAASCIVWQKFRDVSDETTASIGPKIVDLFVYRLFVSNRIEVNATDCVLKTNG